MHQLTKATMNTRKQQGITLIESLVAIVITALAILGILGVQMRTLTDTSTSQRRQQAVRLIEDFSERMKASPNALTSVDDYLTALGDAPALVDCSAGCTNTQLAAHHVAEWKKTVRDTLPLGKASIFIPPAEDGLAAAQRRQLGLLIAWRQNERIERKSGTSSDDPYLDQIDASKRTNDLGQYVNAANDDNKCPEKFTCHLQYIPVPARCAPYLPGGATKPTFYCPGP